MASNVHAGYANRSHRQEGKRNGLRASLHSSRGSVSSLGLKRTPPRSESMDAADAGGALASAGRPLFSLRWCKKTTPDLRESIYDCVASFRSLHIANSAPSLAGHFVDPMQPSPKRRNWAGWCGLGATEAARSASTFPCLAPSRGRAPEVPAKSNFKLKSQNAIFARDFKPL